MTHDLELEQLFVRRRDGRIETLLVFEDPAGGRHRERLPLPRTTPGEAVAVLGRILARRGDVAGNVRPRVREERGDDLVDRPELADAFLAAFDAEADGEA